MNYWLAAIFTYKGLLLVSSTKTFLCNIELVDSYRQNIEVYEESLAMGKKTVSKCTTKIRM